MTEKQGDTIIGFLKGLMFLMAVGIGLTYYELLKIAGRLPH